jgi:DNA-directed RNA polymerase subunit RPC12/RpoP
MECKHESKALLDSNDNYTFYKCDDCGAYITVDNETREITNVK